MDQFEFLPMITKRHWEQSKRRCHPRQPWRSTICCSHSRIVQASGLHGRGYSLTRLWGLILRPLHKSFPNIIRYAISLSQRVQTKLRTKSIHPPWAAFRSMQGGPPTEAPPYHSLPFRTRPARVNVPTAFIDQQLTMLPGVLRLSGNCESTRK